MLSKLDIQKQGVKQDFEFWSGKLEICGWYSKTSCLIDTIFSLKDTPARLLDGGSPRAPAKISNFEKVFKERFIFI